MISLARHIEILLLENDCVIVPGLGGFIANNNEARYNDAGDALFLPPYRTVGFNQQLQVNDGLLVQSYMAVYDASYPAAYLQMEKEIENLMQELDREGSVELEGIGKLTKSISNNISFISNESGITTPSLYGLYSFEVKSLEMIVKEREIEDALRNASSMQVAGGMAANADAEKERKDVVIRLRRRWIDIAISTAAAIVLFFGISYPTLNNTAQEGDTCVATICNVTEKPSVKPSQSTVKTEKAAEKKETERESVSKAEESKTEESKTEKPKAEDPKAGTSKTESPIAEASTPVAEAKYSIVIASYVSKANAEEYISKMTKNGYPEGRFAKNGKVSRILYSNFATETEAKTKLNELRKEAKEFAEAWIIAL